MLRRIVHVSLVSTTVVAFALALLFPMGAQADVCDRSVDKDSPTTRDGCQQCSQGVYDDCIRDIPSPHDLAMRECEQLHRQCLRNLGDNPPVADVALCQQEYEGCIAAAPPEAANAVPREDELRCRDKAQNELQLCIDAIDTAASDGKTGGSAPKNNGCYCFKQQAAGNAEVSSAVKDKEFIADQNLPRLCADKQLPDGTQLTQCEWVGPDPEAPTDADKRRLFDGSLGPKVQGLNQLGTITPQQLIGRAIKLAMGIIGTIALIVLVGAGLLWMTAAGNSDREKRAMDMMFWGALGVIVSLGSYSIVTFIIENAFTVG